MIVRTDFFCPSARETVVRKKPRIGERKVALPPF